MPGPLRHQACSVTTHPVQECLLASLLDPLENERWKWPIPFGNSEVTGETDTQKNNQERL